MRYLSLLIVSCTLLGAIAFAADAPKAIEAIIEKHNATVARAESTRNNLIQKSKDDSIIQLVKFANDAYSKKDRLGETAAWKTILGMDRNHLRARQYFSDLGTLQAVLEDLPENTIASTMAIRPGRWVTRYGGRDDGAEMTIFADGRMRISFNKKQAGDYQVAFKNGSALIQMPHNNSTERWTVAGDRMLVEHWFPQGGYAPGIPPSLIGYAVRVE